MLIELHVRDLGVIEDLHLVLGPGMTAVTGETGAGKTLVVEAIELLIGAKAAPSLVRSGASEASVEGRFVDGDDEVVLRRIVPASGRSRAYRDGEMVPVTALLEMGAALVDLHGQHAYQSLLSARGQRSALDSFAGVDLGPLRQARGRVGAADEALGALGGDPRARARELDLLRFQRDEIDAAAVVELDEEDRLEREEDVLADATAHREAGLAAYEILAAEDGAGDRLRNALAALGARPPFAASQDRLSGVVADVDDLTSALRSSVDAVIDDPERLEVVRARRQLLLELRRKYGATLREVLEFRSSLERQIATLVGHEGLLESLMAELAAAQRDAEREAELIAAQRRAAAPDAAQAVEDHLRALALPGAGVRISVEGEAPADNVSFLLAANRGETPLPLTKVASGGELARVMLALRLVLTDGPSTMIFDEVDAGVGGTAAIAVGRALARLAAAHQVIVVTHLPQVAAFADNQVQVTKSEAGERVVAHAAGLDHHERVLELSRMLAGQPDSASARDHAAELLATASRERNP